MKRLLNLPKRSRVPTLFILGGSVLLALLCFLHSRAVEAEYQRGLTQLAQGIVSQNKSLWHNPKAPSANSALAGFHAEPRILEARLFNNNGDPISTYTSAKGNSALIPNRFDRVGFTKQFRDIFLSEQITIEGQPKGGIYIHATRTEPLKRWGPCAVTGLAVLSLFTYLLIKRRSDSPYFTATVGAPSLEERSIKLYDDVESDKDASYIDKLEKSNKELQAYAYVASHDLKEPLLKVCAFADRLKSRLEGTLDEKSMDFLNRLLSATTRMQNLIDDLLKLSTVSSAEEPFRTVDLSVVLKQAVEDLEHSIQQANASIETQPLPRVSGDPNQIRQLFQNLISNGIKFQNGSNVAPKIVVSGQEIPDDFCEVRVQDNGIGFDEIYLDRIFQPFERLHGRSMYEGTGMGLTICKKIVERHGGTITAQSRVDQGATFIIRLPLAR